MAKAWKYDVNATTKAFTDEVDSATGIEADIQFEGDVKTIVDAFTAERFTFDYDSKDPSKLAYELKMGEGLLSTSVVGWWEISADDTELILKEWDSSAGAEKAPKTYTIKELTDEKLVIQEKGAASPKIYIAE